MLIGKDGNTTDRTTRQERKKKKNAIMGSETPRPNTPDVLVFDNLIDGMVMES